MVPNKLPQDTVQEWSETSFDAEADAVSAAMRAQVIARMELRLEQTIDEIGDSRRRARVYAGLACAAALCVAAFGTWRWNNARIELAHAPAALARVQSVQGSVSVTRAGIAAAPMTDDTTLAPGDDVVTATNGRTRVELADGVSLTLGEASRLSLPKTTAGQALLAQAHEQIGLSDGIVAVKVPHLTQGRTFAVKTPDAEVTVHGTAFTVEVGEFVSADLPLRSGSHAPDANITTRVRVAEGVVSVTNGDREVFVRAGMQWISPHAEPVAPAPEHATPGTNVTPAPSASTALNGGAVQKTVASSLAEQTKLLESAMSASARGDFASAISELNDLHRRYPASGLDQERRVQLFRALQHSGDSAGAAREARRYLAAYPAGYAQEEAKKLALDH